MHNSSLLSNYGGTLIGQLLSGTMFSCFSVRYVGDGVSVGECFFIARVDKRVDYVKRGIYVFYRRRTTGKFRV